MKRYRWILRILLAVILAGFMMGNGGGCPDQHDETEADHASRIIGLGE
ncbi:MAG: hypothetical protein ACYTBZ_07060 [Planctomycetota bacterium]